jgi:hypothetical protein
MSLAWYARMFSRRCSPAVIALGAPRRTRGRACGRASRARCAAVLATGVGVDGCRPVSVGVGGILERVWKLSNLLIFNRGVNSRIILSY